MIPLWSIPPETIEYVERSSPTCQVTCTGFHSFLLLFSIDSSVSFQVAAGKTNIFAMIIVGLVLNTSEVPTKKVKTSHPHNRVTFSPVLLWSQIQSLKRRGWEQIRQRFSRFLTIHYLCWVSESLFSVVATSSLFITKLLFWLCIKKNRRGLENRHGL